MEVKCGTLNAGVGGKKVAHARSFLGIMYAVQNEDKYNENCAMIG